VDDLLLDVVVKRREGLGAVALGLEIATWHALALYHSAILQCIPGVMTEKFLFQLLRRSRHGRFIRYFFLKKNHLWEFIFLWCKKLRRSVQCEHLRLRVARLLIGPVTANEVALGHVLLLGMGAVAEDVTGTQLLAREPNINEVSFLVFQILGHTGLVGRFGGRISIGTTCGRRSGGYGIPNNLRSGLINEPAGNVREPEACHYSFCATWRHDISPDHLFGARSFGRRHFR
jgi:hypothetical protein